MLSRRQLQGFVGCRSEIKRESQFFICRLQRFILKNTRSLIDSRYLGSIVNKAFVPRAAKKV